MMDMPADVSADILRELREVKLELAELRSVVQARPRAESKHCSKAEAADLLHCSTRHVNRLIATGRLQATRVTPGGSSRVLISRASVDALLGVPR